MLDFCSCLLIGGLTGISLLAAISIVSGVASIVLEIAADKCGDDAELASASNERCGNG